MKPQVYVDPRPPEHFARFHERTRRGHAGWTYELVRMLLTPYLMLVFRTRCIDSDKVPAAGPAIVAPNHFSNLDHFFLGVYLRRKLHFLAKSQLFRPPLQFVFTHGGVFPILRGKRDEEAFATAHAVLARGDLLVMYSEGGRSRGTELGEPKPGIGRLALESGAPVVPAAIVGSEGARDWWRMRFPKVTVQYGDPLRFERVESPTREQAQAASEAIFEEIRALHDGLRAGGRREAVRAARAARRS
nr:1-acyl-sn-glycerol-3-phosphate acyltransferase [Actinomycetota bacterium]